MKDWDEGDFMRLFMRHEGSLRGFARTLLPNWEMVDDLLQEASVVMWKKMDQLDDEEGFLPWALTVVRFQAMRVRRTAARDRLMLCEDIMELLAKESIDLPESILTDEREALEVCLSKMSESSRQLVLAPYTAPGAVKEIAERTGRTVNSLYKQLGRLRESLRSCVKTKASWA